MIRCLHTLLCVSTSPDARVMISSAFLSMIMKQRSNFRQLIWRLGYSSDLTVPTACKLIASSTITVSNFPVQIDVRTKAAVGSSQVYPRCASFRLLYTILLFPIGFSYIERGVQKLQAFGKAMLRGVLVFTYFV